MMKNFPIQVKSAKKIHSGSIACIPNTVYYCKKGTCDLISDELHEGDFYFQGETNRNRISLHFESELYAISMTGKSLYRFLEKSNLLSKHLFRKNDLTYYEEICSDIEAVMSLYSKAVTTDIRLDASFFLYRILVRLQYTFYPQYIETKSRQRAVISPAFDLIDSSIFREITTQELADKCEISRKHLNQLFFELTGFSPRAYIAQYRLNRFKRNLFYFPDRSIKELASDCGFISIPSFQHFFLKETGMTPLQYKEQNKNVLTGDDFRLIALWLPIHITNTSNKQKAVLDHFKFKPASYRLYFVTKGLWEITLEDKTVITLDKGDIYCNPPYRKNLCRSLSDEAHFFEVNFSGTNEGVYLKELMRILCNNQQTVFRVPDDYHYDFIEAASFINRNFWYRDRNVQIEISLKIYEILYQLHQLKNIKTVTYPDSMIGPVKERLHNTLNNEMLSVNELANICNLSTSQFLKEFKNEYHTTPKKYIKSMQMKYAAEKLSHQRTMLIKEIALELGYFSTSYFSSEFKKTYGMSPREYRATHSK
ncbi:MAG: helix-turn-helix domain-containing protein [Lachnospiraceae bacterium]